MNWRLPQPHVLRSSVRVPHWSVLLLLATVAALVFLTASIAAEPGRSGAMSPAIATTFALNGAVGIVFLCKSISERPFSMSQMHWMFYVTMFVVAPFSQCWFGYSPWGYALSQNDYLVTNAALALWAALFAFFSAGGRSRHGASAQREFYASMPAVSEQAAMRAVIVAAVATVTVVLLVGTANLFSRGDFSTGLDKTASLLFDKAVRPLPVFAFVLVLARAKQQGKPTPLLLAAAVLMLVACFPAAMARYNMACIYGAVLLLACAPLFEKKGLFLLLFLLVFLVVFPAANAYRVESFTFSMFGEALLDALSNLPHGFCAVDYDAYSMVARTLRYTGDAGATNGYQLLGALLFFVPRSIWPSKPEGSGNLVCAAQGQTTLNISSPFPAEGIANFGIIGLIAFAVVAALVCRELDRWSAESSTPLKLFYPFACMLLFFVMRGDLLSSIAYSVGYVASFSLLMVVCLGPKVCFAPTRMRGGYSQWLAFPALSLHRAWERLICAVDFSSPRFSRLVALSSGAWSL